MFKIYFLSVYIAAPTNSGGHPPNPHFRYNAESEIQAHSSTIKGGAIVILPYAVSLRYDVLEHLFCIIAMFYYYLYYQRVGAEFSTV